MPSIIKNLNAISRGTTLFRDERLSGCGLTGYQVKYVFAVAGAEGVSQDELARSLFINKSNVARQMSVLEEAGFIRREQSSGDKRVYEVFLTERARALVPLLRAANAEWEDIICAGLSAEEKSALASALAKLVENVRAYEEERGEKNS